MSAKTLGDWDNTLRVTTHGAVSSYVPAYQPPVGAAVTEWQQADHDVVMNVICDHPSLTPASQPATHDESKRILVVENDPLMCGLMSATLEDAGHRVKTVADGDAAWRALLASKYDLVVTEDIMPKVSGLALVRRIRVADMALRVIVASARLDAADVVKLSRDPWSRFDAFVRKPFTTSDLIAAVHGVLTVE